MVESESVMVFGGWWTVVSAVSRVKIREIPVRGGVVVAGRATRFD